MQNIPNSIDHSWEIALQSQQPFQFYLKYDQEKKHLKLLYRDFIKIEKNC